MAGWLPQILNDLGYGEIDAGYIFVDSTVFLVVPSAAMLPFLGKSNNQRWLVPAFCTSSVFIGLIGLLYLPDFAIFWVGLFGLANCSTFIIALSFVGLRTSKQQPKRLRCAGMAQGIGYALAAAGPTLVGNAFTSRLLERTDSFLIAGVAFACTIFAALAARDTKVSV